MTTLIIAAFTMGIIGSFHCVGMCGPLALSLPLNNNTIQSKLLGVLLYNFGRITTYSFLGFAFGMIGKSMVLFGFQQWLSIVLGISILVIILLAKYFPIALKHFNWSKRFFEVLRGGIGKLFFSKNPASLYSIGVLNGLLPCGLVYMAIAGSIAISDLTNSVVFMAAFGFGTVPAMCMVAFFGNYISINLRKKMRQFYPFMMMLIACLLILRGMGLGIPYVSPAIEKDKKEVHGCCAKPK
jgi:sulfite exporter TauE/SafE